MQCGVAGFAGGGPADCGGPQEWERMIDAGEVVAPAAQVVVVRFAPVRKGQSIRLRISETYTAIGSYRLEVDDLVFDRSLGRPRNAVVLPEGWYLTASAIPATVSLSAD